MFNFDKQITYKKNHPNYIHSRFITGVAPPSFRRNVDGWDYMKHKHGGKIILKVKENISNICRQDARF